MPKLLRTEAINALGSFIVDRNQSVVMLDLVKLSYGLESVVS